MTPSAAELFRLVASGGQGPIWLPAVRLAAGAASRLYGLAAHIHHLAYDLGVAKIHRLPAPVIGVGNITVGGTGKTPLVMAVVAALQDMDLPCAVISRGYGGRAGPGVRWVSYGQGPLLDATQAGDEPVLLAKRLDAPVAVGPDRFSVGQEVLRRMGPCVLVGDDLFQHRDLHRDLDLVVLDAELPLGNGRPLPRGPLREPASNLRRAQVVALTHAEDWATEQQTRAWLRTFWGSGPVLSCRHVVRGLMDWSGDDLPSQAWRGKRVLAFCGLGAPDKFARSLGGMGLDLAGLETFADHHPFSVAEIDALWCKAWALGAEALITSEKDWVRLPAGPPPDARIWITRLELEFSQGKKALRDALLWGLSTWRLRA